VSDDGSGGKAYSGLDASTGASRAMTYDTCVSQGEDNVLNVVPLALMLVYRFDVLDKRFRIPIIPYIKAGIGYYIWWFGKTGSFVADVQTATADGPVSVQSSGATAGLVLNPGLAIDLSVLDPASARVMDQELGLNRVTAFIELNAAFMEGWGARSTKLNLSDTTFSAGLGFEF
jgi:hypothetical protein